MYTPYFISPYRAGICWHGVRAAEANGPQRFCGAGAGKYRIIRKDEDNLVSSLEIMEVWLCYKHVTALEQKGYCCHKIDEIT